MSCSLYHRESFQHLIIKYGICCSFCSYLFLDWENPLPVIWVCRKLSEVFLLFVCLFWHGWILYSSDALSAFIEMFLIFLLHPIHMVNNTDLIFSVRPWIPGISTTWFNRHWIQFTRIFYISIWERLLIILLSCNGFVGYWFQDYIGFLK